MPARKLARISLLAGALLFSTPLAVAAATSGGVAITLSCESGTAGSGTFRVTANQNSSLVTVTCGGSATVTNPAWTAGTMATIEPTAVPKGTYVVAPPTVFLARYLVHYSTALAPCPTGRYVPTGCPQPDLRRAFLGLAAAYLVLIPIVGLLVLIVVVPFEFWMIRGWIRYFSRKQDPREVIEDLSARPGIGWWVRRYVAYVRMKHRLFGVPLPPGFDDRTDSSSVSR